MKKLLLSGLIALMSTFAFGQANTFIGTSTNRVEVRHLLQIDGLSNSVGNDSALIIDGTTHHVIQKIISGGGYSLPTATPTILGGVKIDGTTIHINSGIISATNPTYTIAGDVTGSGSSTITVTLGGGVVVNSKLANMPAFTIKGNNTSGSATPLDLSILQTKTMLSLDQVDNTTDISKPISTLVTAALGLKAPLASPTLTGVPQAPTAPNGTNTDQIATTKFVIANAVSGGSYILPIASFSSLGGVKIGTGLAIDGSGLLSATNSGVSSVFGRSGAVTAQSGDYNFALLGSIPTTLAGHHITDAYPLVGNPSNFLTSVPAQTWSSLTGKPTSLSAAGITDPVVRTDGSYTDPAWIISLNWSKLISKPTTIAGYNISDAVSLTGTQTLTNKTITAPLGIVKADVGLGNVDNTSDVTKNAASVTLTNKAISGSTNTVTNLPESATTNLVPDLAAKAPINNPTFTGTATLPLTTNATIQTDVIPLFTFGAGSAITGDTTWATTVSLNGSLLITGANNYVITSINIVLQGSSPNITVDVRYGATLNSGGTSLNSGGTAVTNTTTGTTVSVGSVSIAPGNFIWCKTPTVVTGSKPTYLQVTVSGYKVRN